MGIGDARVVGHRLPQCRYGIRYPSDLEAGDAQVVENDGIGRVQPRCFAQWSNGISRLAGAEQLRGQRQCASWSRQPALRPAALLTWAAVMIVIGRPFTSTSSLRKSNQQSGKQWEPALDSRAQSQLTSGVGWH